MPVPAEPLVRYPSREARPVRRGGPDALGGHHDHPEANHPRAQQQQGPRGDADVPAGPAAIKIAGTANVGKFPRARQERHSIEIPVVVTGDLADVVIGHLACGQDFEIEFRGVRAAGVAS